MQPPTDSALLGIWERGHGRNPVERALLVLAAALPESDGERLAALSIGERDATILRLRRATFGTQLPGCVVCPRCGETLEFELDADHLLPGLRAPAECEFTIGDGLRFRLPDSRDLLAVAHCANADAAGQQLLQRCCLNAPDAREWPQTLRAEIEARMAALDDAAEIRLQFDCISCGQTWADQLDIACYFWEEIEQHARRLLDEVHWLAARYGWAEAQILAMSAARRNAYLQRWVA